MHVLAFETKRAHWKMVGFAARLFGAHWASYGPAELLHMTAARYDILFAMWQRPAWVERKPEWVYGMSMQKLIERLGLHPSTVSKCVKGLVTRGFVVKTRPYRDKRYLMIEMTEEGLAAFLSAHDALHEDGPAFLYATTTFARCHATPGRLDEVRPRSLFHHGEDADEICAEDDDRLLHFGDKIRALAEEMGSTAWPIYEPNHEEDAYYRFLHQNPPTRDLYALTLQ